MPENSVIKFPDGTMIQTTCVRFNLRKIQHPCYPKQHIRWDGAVDHYNYGARDNRTDKGYTHDREYIAIWRERFIKRPIILTQYYTNGHNASVDLDIAINYQKSTNTEVVFKIWDPGAEQLDRMIIFVGLGRWK